MNSFEGTKPDILKTNIITKLSIKMTKKELNQNFPIRKLLPDEIPVQLMEIPQPPKQLYIRFNLPSTDTKYLCVVGSRRYTFYGKEACEKLIGGLRGYDITIVSGLAIGIDAIAHEAALKNNLKTVALPGSGLDCEAIHPSANLDLAKRILQAGGALLAEFEPDFKATRYAFPQRNRLAAGLSQAVLIIEGETKSGTLITARLATEYNKDVLALPGSIFNKTSEGPHKLIRLGATPITNSGELLEALGFADPNANPKNLQFEYDNCSLEEKIIIKILNEPKPKDEVIQECGLPINEANAVLSVMELKGLLGENLGELFLK